jgi:MSHA type pilus biogenesis protein MshL
MAEPRLTKTTLRALTLPAILAVLSLLTACSAPVRTAKPADHFIEQESQGWGTNAPAPRKAVPLPDFVSVTEDLAPIRTKMVNIVVRNSALGDVLHVVAEASGLNLLIDKDVALDQPVTISLKNVSAEDALKSIFSSVDCFYTVTNNVLKVEAVGTKVFELGHPALVSSYSVDVGGDILGGAMVTASGGSGSSNLKGTVTSGSKADAKAYDFWEALEKALENIIMKKESLGARAARGSESRPQQTTQTGQTPGSQSGQPGGFPAVTDRAANGAGSYGDNQPQQSITVNRLTGTIMLTATRKNMEKAQWYLENVKKVLNRQVMIEARIIEVQLNDGLNFGIDWSFLKNFTGLGGTVNAGLGALNLATTSFNSATAAAAAGSQFQLGISRGDFQALLTALKTQGDVKTLSNPKINVMNGHASILTVGRNTSYIAQVTSTTSTGATPITTFSVQTGSILSGMIIGIVPFISETGDISINITPITSNLVSLQDKSVGSAGNQTTIAIPTVDLREMTTTVKMRDGQIAILGGLISKQDSKNEEKIPVIGDLPYFGKFFTRINNSSTKSELVLMLRPHIVSGDELID